MSDYLGRLAARNLQLSPALRPRLAAWFEPTRPRAGGWTAEGRDGAVSASDPGAAAAPAHGDPSVSHRTTLRRAVRDAGWPRDAADWAATGMGVDPPSGRVEFRPSGPDAGAAAPPPGRPDVPRRTAVRHEALTGVLPPPTQFSGLQAPAPEPVANRHAPARARCAGKRRPTPWPPGCAAAHGRAPRGADGRTAAAHPVQRVAGARAGAGCDRNAPARARCAGKRRPTPWPPGCAAAHGRAPRGVDGRTAAAHPVQRVAGVRAGAECDRNAPTRARCAGKRRPTPAGGCCRLC